MFSALKHKVLNLSAEEEDRRQRVNKSLPSLFRPRRNSNTSVEGSPRRDSATSVDHGVLPTTATTQKKKKKKNSLPVNVDRVVLFNFIADTSHREQISVHANDIVFVHEDCADGWSVVETRRKIKGVVPTSYLAVRAQDTSGIHSAADGGATHPESRTTSATSISSTSQGGPASFITNFFSLNLSQRIDAIKSMFITWVQEKTIVFFQLLFVAAKVLVFDGLIPGLVFIVRLFTLNESYTTIFSGIVRGAFAAGITWMVPNLNDEELDGLVVEVKHFSQTVHDEQQRRDHSVAMLRGVAPVAVSAGHEET